VPKKQKTTAQVLSEILRRNLSKDSALAEKQARLLERLKNDPCSPLYGRPPMPPVEDLLEPLPTPKTYTELLQEGVPHKGGLAQLASAEQMDNPEPAIAGLQVASKVKAATSDRRKQRLRRKRLPTD